MKKNTSEREYFLDSIRAYLMLLGIPFHLSLIYSSHQWAVNSYTPSDTLTVLNDVIHAFRMQVFFVISGYFSYMLYERYESHRWLKVRLERVAIPLLTAFPLITIPQFFLLKNFTDRLQDWDNFNLYEKINVGIWELVSHLWFLLTLCILTCVSFFIFKKIKQIKKNRIPFPISRMTTLGKVLFYIFIFSLFYALLQRTILIIDPDLLFNSLFNFVVLQSLFYLPFFVIGAYAFKYEWLKQLFLKPSPYAFVGSLLLLIAYVANQHLNTKAYFSPELDTIITSLVGILMVNVVFSSGHYLLNSHSVRVTYLVNASLFVYLVHHPLTLIYGAFITPRISSNGLGFLLGLVFVFSIAFMLYEIHKRVPLLRFLFSGKPQH
ncbi:glucans biosynthesis protein MdoC [Edaphovirga cremea]|uniref:glucans biosynthesis protein MdoC n=1 Tax=Edaphovirga cremea TaxID=2267246 RepID=UPI003989B96A